MSDQNGAPLGIRKEVLLLCGDLLALAGCLAFAFILRFGAAVPLSHQLLYIFFWPLLFTVLLFAAWSFGLYDFRHKLTATDHFFAGAGAAGAGVIVGYALLVFIQTYYFPDARLSRVVVIIYALLLIAWFTLSRAAVLTWLRRSGAVVRLALLGPRARCEALRDVVQAYAPPSLTVVGIAATDEWEAQDGAGAGLNELQSFLAETGAHQVLLSAEQSKPDIVQTALRATEQGGVDVYLYPGLDAILLASTRVQGIAGLPLVNLRPPFVSSPYRLGKRLLDVCAAALLLVITAPASGIAAAAIRWTSPGPILFAQERTGLGGETFTVYKFRTMTVDAEGEGSPVLAAEDDPRVTPVGRWLRRWRIDELPQLWNVLRGDMSLVGPRPERPEFVAEFTESTPLYARRHLVRPGLTGLAQIFGRYDSDFTDKIRYDLIYINSLSLATDLKILFSTVQTVLTGSGAR